MYISKNASKLQKGLVSSMWLTLWRKTVFVHIYPLYWFNPKQLFKQIQVFLRFASFKHGRNDKLFEYFSACFCDNNF